jgi:2-methylthioadenine synthetase
MATYHIETYGCSSNRGESREIERALRDGGHRPADGPDDADVAILNTCTVVEKTEQNMLRRAEELSETTADLVVTGCMALAQGEMFEAADVDAEILHWDEVPSYVLNGECPTVTPDAEPVLDGVIGLLPIARGCMSNCSYCITKFATGRVDSPPVAENVEKARALVHAGAKEIRVTGQDTGVYGWDDGDRKLPELLDRICDIDGEFRVRLGMANPGGIHGIHEELADVFARTRSCTTSSTRPSSPAPTTCSRTCAASTASRSSARWSTRSTSGSTTGRSRPTSSWASPRRARPTTSSRWTCSPRSARRRSTSLASRSAPAPTRPI